VRETYRCRWQLGFGATRTGKDDCKSSPIVLLEGADFWGAHVPRMALVMEENKTLGPWHIRLFRPDTHSNYPNIVLVLERRKAVFARVRRI